MNINKTMKEDAAKAMVKQVFTSQFNQLAIHINELALQVYDTTIKPQADVAIKCGTPTEFLKMTERAQILLRTNKTNVKIALRWHAPQRVSLTTPDCISIINRYSTDKEFIVIAHTPKLVVPARYIGEFVLDDEAELNELRERFISIQETSKSLAKEADTYYMDILRVLTPIRTLKNLENIFPAAVPYMPNPEPLKKQVAPVELINNITKRLRTKSGAAK